jgi:hypothetical protein
MHAVFWTKFLLANIALLASLYFIYAKAAILERSPRLFIVGYYLFRIAVLALLFLGLGFKYAGENTTLYVYYGNLVLHGYVPNRDFYVLYGILFSYLLAAALVIWHHPFSLYLLFQLIEFAAVYAIFTQKNSPLPLQSFLRYAFNPIILVWMWLGLQNQAMCLVPVAAVYLFRSEARRSLFFAIGFAISKIFALWTIIPALALQRARSILLFVLVLGAIYLPFLLVGSHGISFLATEANGRISDDAHGSGIESLVGLIPSEPRQIVVGHLVLLITGALLLLVILGCFLLRLRIGTRKVSDLSFEQKLLFTAIPAVLMMLIYQAFASYTAPDYLATAVAFVPVLTKFRFWSAIDQVLFAIMCYFQAVIYLFWFHFQEFGIADARHSGIFVLLLVLGNLFTIGFLGRHAWKTWIFFVRPGAGLRELSPEG